MAVFFTISGSVKSLKVTDLSLNSGVPNVVLVDTASGQLYYTSSAAVGGTPPTLGTQGFITTGSAGAS